MARELTQAELKTLLEYNKDSGVFVWKQPRPNQHRSPGDIAGYKRSDGYLAISINNVDYKAHRLAWLYLHGLWPENEMDHINGVRDDNRFVNLRAVTKSENARNTARSCVNTSGITGVSWNKMLLKWTAYINAQGKRTHLGCFKERWDAICARKRAEVEHGYHCNHGRVSLSNS